MMKFDDAAKYKIRFYSVVGFIIIAFYFVILRIDQVKAWMSNAAGLLSPFIFGIFIAFLLDKPMMLIEKGLKKVHFSHKYARTLAAIISLILGILAVLLFFALIGPQLVDSIVSLLEQTPAMMELFAKHLNDFFENNDISTEIFNNLFGSNFLSDTVAKITSTVTETLPRVVLFGSRVTSTILNMLIGLIAGLYIMLEKEMFIKAVKSVTYAFLKKETADYLTRFANITARVFNDFILGKALDSLIIGILTYILMSLFNMPFALLLSVIVGITNMIPVFGPFIGAIPGIFILTIFDLKTGFYFALLILAIQQFDGNILGPIILGDRLGLPSLAILFSVVVGGGLFGLPGMFIGVPTFAVIYIAVSEIIEERLKKKEIEI